MVDTTGGTAQRRPARHLPGGALAAVTAVVLMAVGCGTPPVAIAPSASATASASSSGSVSAAPSPAASPAGSLEARFEPVMEIQANLAKVGVVVAVVAGDETWVRASGVADEASGREMTPDTTFAIGSITKSIVAATVLQLAEDGEIDLDAPIADYLPPELSDLANGATVLEVLGHHSGIGEHTSVDRFFKDVLEDPDRTWSNREVLEYAGPSAFDAGEGWAYSNTNYILLDIVVEEVTGRPTGESIEERLFEPHGLDRIAYQPSEPPPAPTAVGHEDVDGDGTADRVEGGGLLPTRALATAAGAAGGVAADAPSVARWAHLLYGGDVLEPSSLDAMVDFSGSEGPPYGLGTFPVELGGDLVGVGHDGHIPGFQSAVVHVSGIDATVAVLTNGGLVGELAPMTMASAFVQALAD